MDRERTINYKSSKSIMASVVLGQYDTAMFANLEMTEDWDDNNLDLLFVQKQGLVSR